MQDEDQTYIQGELVGHFTTKDWAAVPEGWAFRPIFGGNFQRFTLEDTTDSVGGLEPGGDFEVGNVWAKGTLAKLTKPGDIAPNFTLGVEHAFTDDYDDFIDEDTHLVVGVGASVLIPGGGNSIAVTLDHREGFNGKRTNTQLTTVFNISF